MMVKKWNGVIWKIYIHGGSTLAVERFATPEADFPYSKVEARVCDIIEHPDLNPCDERTSPDRHKRCGQISMGINSMMDLWDLVLMIVREGEDI